MLRIPLLLPAALTVLLLASPAVAQAPRRAAAAGEALSPRDSARVLRDARSEQGRFERTRRSHLPWAWGGGSGHCDERIGRFCLTHGGSDEEWEPPPEAEEVVAARDRLAEHLSAAARLLPGDTWIAGQRVRYLVEAGRWAEAAAAARECRAERWWCTALAGFTLHQAGEAGKADSTFSVMLRMMPREERRRWADLSLLLDDCTRREYRRMEEDEKEGFEKRFWHLADPFHTRPGNELRSEHFARNVWDLLQDRAKSTEGISWGDDLREIVLRYGWPHGWERMRGRAWELGPTSLVSHYANSDRVLLPPCEVLTRDGRLSAGAWDTEDDRARTGYSLPMPDSAIEWVKPLGYQIAAFRRGDSVVVVAAYELPEDSLPAGARAEAALAVLPAVAEGPRVSRFPVGGSDDVLTAGSPTGDMLLSLEVLALEARRAARARQGLSVPALVPGLMAVSDLLLLRAPEPLPDSLAGAVREARRSNRVRPGERVGVYWEVYGLAADAPEALTISLRLVEEGGGWLARLARRIGILERLPPVRVRWQEQASGAPVFARSLAIEIPGDLGPGRYAMELSVAAPGREPLVVRRAVEVLP